MNKPEFDIAEAHRYFAAHCFNAAWDLIEKRDRTEADDRLMVALAQASIYHWLNRPDVADKNLAIGYWQASRVHALVGAPEEAKRCAEICLAFSRDLEPFHQAYAHEALARAARVLGDHRGAAAYLKNAWNFAKAVQDEKARRSLETDLESLGATQQEA
ncbi:MAG TPA: hypothetical protein VMT54_13460 [Candidatus Cybelea sp.]|nr:hypothetical protein [Candidatus Cybelea sp.]